MNMTAQDDREKGSEAPQEAAALPVPYSIFTSRQKALIVTIVSHAATFSAFASNIYFPAIPAIAKSLHVTPELINLTITSYMILQGLSPSIVSISIPFSDSKNVHSQGWLQLGVPGFSFWILLWIFDGREFSLVAFAHLGNLAN